MTELQAEKQNPSAVIDEIIEQWDLSCQYPNWMTPVVKNTSIVLYILIRSAFAKLDQLKDIIVTLKEKKVTVHFILLWNIS